MTTKQKETWYMDIRICGHLFECYTLKDQTEARTVWSNIKDNPAIDDIQIYYLKGSSRYTYDPEDGKTD